MMKKTRIPKRYIEIVKEKEKPTTYIMQKKTGLLQGRLEKGDKRKKGFLYGKMGRTRVIRMKKKYKGFEKGQIISRTKKSYPRQVNSVLVRKDRTGKITAVKVVVGRYERTSKKGRNHSVKKHKRKIRKRT